MSAFLLKIACKACNDFSENCWQSKDLFGKLFGDKGYISQELFTKLKKNMKNKLMSIVDKLLLRSRGVIESVNNKLKSGCQIEHHRHLSPRIFFVNLYAYDSSKPSIRMTKKKKQAFLDFVEAQKSL